MHPASTPAHRVAHPFQFTGRAGEFFKIWIVNICLTILTLGIYSAWAKVRTQQYFYGNTLLAGSSFEYTAQPITILKGRLLTVAAVFIYAITTTIWPLTAPLFMLLFAALLPWLISRSLKFRALNSRYRNLRFNFDGQYWDAFINFLLLPGLSFFTLGILYPFAIYLQQRWLIKHSSYGRSRFRSDLTAGPIYKAYLLGALILFGGFMLVVILGIASATMAVDNSSLKNDLSGAARVLPDGLSAFAGLIMLPVYYFAFVYIRARVANAALNSAQLEQHGLQSTLQARRLFVIYLTNTLAILCSLGLLIPWAKIRIARYKATCTTFIAGADLDHFTQAQQEQQNAIGEEMSDILDVEFGL